MTHAEPNQLPQDDRAWTQTLAGVGPLTFLAKDKPASEDTLGDLGTFTSLDAGKAVVALGSRVARGLGVFAGLLVLPFGVAFLLLGLQSGLQDGYEVGLYVGVGMFVLVFAAAALMIAFDLNRVAETLVLLNRNTGQIISADPNAPIKRASDIRFRTWNWDECEFAVERVIMSATAAQTFHLRAVRLNAQGEPEDTALLAAMVPSIDHALALFEFLRRYMAHDDANLPAAVKLVPAGRLNFFEACKQSFITYLIDVGEDGLPQWPWPLVALFYAALAVGLVMAFPFVLGKVVAEWSSQEMTFPPGTVPTDGKPLPGVRLIPARQAVFAPWEKGYYLACMGAGLIAWIFGVRHVISVFSGG